MNADEEGSELTEKIIGCAFRVANALGNGFLEKVYENALVIELRSAGLRTLQQQPILVRYQGVVVGDYVADVIVEDRVLLELKACSGIEDIRKAQLINHLKATAFRLGC